MHEYGKANWEKLWESLEREGNVGLDYVINPYLYPEIINILAGCPKAIVADFGCGTNLMGVQLLFGYPQSVPALKNEARLGEARFNTLLYVGVEGSAELVSQGNRYLHDIGNPKNIGMVSTHIGKDMTQLFDSNSVDLCVSRNFLMHLSLEDFEAHLRSVAEILKPQASYIFATLNPAYELQKAGKVLANGEEYEFLHGGHGEYGTFYHYFKSQDYLDETIEKYFTIKKKQACLPISDKFKETHARYYSEIPMAFVYSLQRR